jgi:hypothetical protein
MKSRNALIVGAACVLLLVAWPPRIGAEEEPGTSSQGLRYVPMMQYESLSLGAQRVMSPGLGIALMDEGLMATGFYTGYRFGKDLALRYPRNYHSIDFLVDGKRGPHNYLVVFKSSSDVPAYGGFETFQSAMVYGRRVVDGRNGSLTLGGGIAVSDFGIELADGTMWPVIPVPLIRGQYETSLLSTSLEFITGPNLNVVLFHDRPLRLVGDFRMDEYRDARDLIFETLISYYPTFAGISVGITNNAYSFDLGGEEEKFELHYRAVFASLDLAVLKFSVGYAFDAREQYREEHTRRPEDGIFLSLQGLYQF